MRPQVCECLIEKKIKNIQREREREREREKEKECESE
jgi:hypothetical protein